MYRTGLLFAQGLAHESQGSTRATRNMAITAPVSVLFISCWSLREPQCQRLNLDPLRQLAQEGYRIHLMTFERQPYRCNGTEEAQWRAALLREGIVWHPVAYHHRPLLLAKMVDGLAGVWTGWRLMRREPIRLLHARSEFPAAIASILAWLKRLPMLYESDGLISEERVDVGLWRREGLIYRLTCALERWLPRVSQEMIVLTQRYADRLRQQGVRVPVTVLPSCTDIKRFHRDPGQRTTLRGRMGWSDQLVFVYSGQIGGWYQFEQMADFFARLKAVVPRSHWLCLVNNEPSTILRLVESRGVPSASITVRSVLPEEVPQWLAASDLALAFIRAGTSKFASSPTKIAEYLACGLPVIMTAGVGDTEQLLTEHEVGYVLNGLDHGQYDRAIDWVEWLIPRLAPAAAKCRQIAVDQLAVQKTGLSTYREIYRRLAQVPCSASNTEVD